MLGAMTPESGAEALAFPNTPSAFPPSSKNGYISGDCRRAYNNGISSNRLLPSRPNSSSISTISSSSSSSSSSSNRFPSQIHNPPPILSALPQGRSQPLDRIRISPDDGGSDRKSNSGGRIVLRNTVRSLPVSFQGESFFFQTSKVKPSPLKPTTECRKPIATFAGVENSQPNDQQMRRPSTATARGSNLVNRSLDCSVDSGNRIIMTVRLLLDNSNSNIGDRSLSLGSDSNLGSPESVIPAKLRTKPRGICVPARFRQENGSPRPFIESPKNLVTGKQNAQLPSPRSAPSPSFAPNKSSSAVNGVSRVRRNIMTSYCGDQIGNAPSIISFASEVRRSKKGESKIEDAHRLRLFHNRYLQWRYINSTAENAFSNQMTSTENNLYNAWITISELHDSAMNKQIQLQLLRQNMKLASILEDQIAYLDEWSTVDDDHVISVRGAIEALEASTLRLPVLEGAKVDIHEVKDTLHSAIAVMQAMVASICSSLSKVEEISSLMSELSKLGGFESSLLNQSRDLLSKVATLHVKQCSLQGCLIQLGRQTKPETSAVTISPSSTQNFCREVHTRL